MSNCEHNIAKVHCPFCVKTIADCDFEIKALENTINNFSPRADEEAKQISRDVSLIRAWKTIKMLATELCELRRKVRAGRMELGSNLDKGKSVLDLPPLPGTASER